MTIPGQVQRELSALHALSVSVSSSLSPDVVASAALEGLVDIVGSDLVALYRLQGEAMVPVRRWLRGSNPGAASCGVERRGQCLCGTAAMGQPVYVLDLESSPTCCLVACLEAGIRSSVSLPLRGREGIIGVLGLGSRVQRDFRVQGEFLETVANVVATALENALVHEQVRLHAEELARELALRTRAEKALEEHERRLETVISSMPVGVAISDREGRVEYLNEKFVGTFGYTLEEIPTVEHWHRLAYPDERYRGQVVERWSQALRAAADRGREFEPMLVHVTCKDASVLAVEIVGRPLGERDLVIFQDVTERQRAESALRQSGERLRTVVENSPIVLFALDREGVFTLSEGKGLAALGLQPGQVVGMSAFDVYRNVPDVLLGVRRALQGEALSFTTRVGDLMFEAWYQPLEDERGQFSGTIGVALDVTKERRVLDEKARLEFQLAQSQKMEAVGQLAGGIAHDFNNMLTAITGYASLLERKLAAEPRLKRYAEQILASSEKSSNLTRQLLAFSRKQVISPAPTDLNSLVKGMERLLLRLIGEDVAFTTVLDREALVTLVDTGQIEQVLLNLCTNARDAMPRGGRLCIGTKALRVDAPSARAHGLQGPGRYAVLTVTDNGTGIDETVRPRVFEPFFTTKEVGRGTGLGLSIVYGIVKQHGGHIAVYSEKGVGTEVKVYLPLVDPSLSSSPLKVVPELRGGTETILVAEDNDEVRSLVCQVLHEYGYAVLEAADGEEAVSRFAENRDGVALVVLDVIMPKKSGRDAAEAIRRIRADVSILYTSGYTADIITRAGIDEEGGHFIAKPVTPPALLLKVREILDARRGPSG